MTLKKVLPFILITVVIFGIFFGPFNTRKADAVFKVTRMTASEVLESFVPSANVLKILADVAQAIVWTPAKFIFTVAGMALNKSIDFSISGPFFAKLAAGDAVTKGWGLSRDIVNIFLIFILLYIAIATILQVSGYGAKELLLTLIIIAFLVNFSLVITKLIIDASNVLAMGFYNTFPKTTENGQTTIAVSEAFKNAFDAGKIINMDKSFESDAFKDLKNLYLIELLCFLLGSAIMVIAAFIFFVFSILFLIRMVVLSILMIFAPLAFAAMILPSTKPHASKWWSALFNQSFFAPAALFMLWISAMIANGGFIKNALGVGDAGLADMLVAFGSDSMNWDNVVKFVLNFVIIAILLCTSLVVAKQMGAYGAESVQKGLKNAGKKLQGYAGRIGKRYAAPLAATMMATKEGKPRWISKVPLVGRGLARATTMTEPEISKYEKQYGSSSDAALNVLMQRQHLLNLSQRKAIVRIQKKRAGKKKRQDIIKDQNAPSLEKIKALIEEAEETVESASKMTTIEKETKKT